MRVFKSFCLLVTIAMLFVGSMAFAVNKVMDTKTNAKNEKINKMVAIFNKKFNKKINQNDEGGIISIIDTATKKVVGDPIMVGGMTMNVKTITYKGLSFVYASSWDPVDDDLYVIDINPGSPTYNKVVRHMSIESAPVIEITANPNNSGLVYLLDASGYIVTIGASTQKIIGYPIKTSEDPDAGSGAITITPNGKFAYVMNGENTPTTKKETVAVVDIDWASPNYGKIIDTIDAGAYAYLPSILCTQDGNFAYMTTANNTVSVINIDPSSKTYNTIVEVIPLDGNHDVAKMSISPDGKSVYVPTWSTDGMNIDIISTKSQSISDKIHIAGGDAGSSITDMSILKNGKQAYVSVITDIGNEVNIVDIDPYSPTYKTVVGKVLLGDDGLGFLALSPDDAFAYVLASHFSEKNNKKQNWNEQIKKPWSKPLIRI